MINYGNSKALVHVNDSNQELKAWGQTGTILEGQPLAIQFNENVFQDKPEDNAHDIITEEHFSKQNDSPENSVPNQVQFGEGRAQTHQVNSRKELEKNKEKEGFFITANQNDDGVDMMA